MMSRDWLDVLLMLTMMIASSQAGMTSLIYYHNRPSYTLERVKIAITLADRRGFFDYNVSKPMNRFGQSSEYN